MKYAMILILCAFLLVGCTMNQQNDSTGTSASVEEDGSNIIFSSGIYYNKKWDDQTGTYLKMTIPDMETAVAVASAVFDGMTKSDSAEDFTPQYVFYDEVDGIWIVSFWKVEATDAQNPSVVTVGYSCSIAIDEEDGTVLRIWFGE